MRPAPCLATLAALLARLASADIPLPPPSDQELLAAKGHVVAAVMIEDVQPPVGTRGQPPRVSLRIEEVIRGSLPTPKIVAEWAPPDYNGDPYPGDTTPPASWLAEPLPSPPAGTRLILLLSRADARWRIANRCRYPDTPQIRRQVRKAIDDYIVVTRRWRRQAAIEERAARARFEARKISWRASATAEGIARSATEADFVGIGRLSSGPNGARATFEFTQILKGARRQRYRGSAYFADVDVPPVFLDLEESDFRFRDEPLLLFLRENGMDLSTSSAPHYPLTSVGLVLADTEARQIVREALAGAPRRPPTPLCLVMIAGYASALSPEENRALGARITETLAAAGRQRCNVASGSGLTDLNSPDWVVSKVRELFVGVHRAVLVSIDNQGVASLQGIRIGHDVTTVVFAGEPWPPEVSAQREMALRVLRRLVAAR